MASIISKVKKAATNYAKNVVGGAGIVASGVSSVAKSIASDFAKGAGTPVGKGNQSGIAPIKKQSTGSKITVPVNQLGRATSKITVPVNRLGTDNISSDGTALQNKESFSSSNSSPSSSTTSLRTNIKSIPTTPIVNAQTLATQNTRLTVPEITTPDYSTSIPAVTPLISLDEQRAKIEAEKTKRDDDLVSKLFREFNNKDTGAEIEAKLQRELGIQQKQQQVYDLTNQLNAIVDGGERAKLALPNQGRGIPEYILNGQAHAINRQVAIDSLHVSSQLQAAQGNLEMANDSLDRLFKIYSDDAENEFKFRTESIKMVYEIANENDKRKLDKIQKQEERAYQEQQDLNDERSAYAKMAFANGQSSLGAKIAKLDYKSPTFKQDLANLSSQIVDSKRNLEIQKLQKDLANAGTTINPKVLSTTQFKNAQAAQNLKNTLDRAKTAVEKYGNYEQLSGTGKGILDALKIQLSSQISTALEQGVVMPGEMENFQKVAGQLQSSIFTRNSKTLGSLNELSQSMDERIALQKSALTNTYNITPEQVDTLLNITELSDQEFADMDALIE